MLIMYDASWFSKHSAHVYPVIFFHLTVLAL